MLFTWDLFLVILKHALSLMNIQENSSKFSFNLRLRSNVNTKRLAYIVTVFL